MIRIVASGLLTVSIAGCWGSDETAAPPASVSTTLDQRQVRYVSPTGDDAGPGSAARPWASLAHSLPELRAGQTLLVRGGDYFEALQRLPLHDGKQASRIVVQAFPGERPILHGSISLWRPNYWTIDGLNVTRDGALNGSDNGHVVKLAGGVGWTWQNSEIWGGGGAVNLLVTGQRPGEPAGWAFTGNCVHDEHPALPGHQPSNLVIGHGVSGSGEIARNVIFRAPDGRNIVVGSDVPMSAGARSGIAVRYNTVYGAGVSLTLTGMTSGALVERNIFAAPFSGILLRGNRLTGSGNVVQHNLGVGARRVVALRPSRAVPDPSTLTVGPGNLMTDDVGFPNPASCTGFDASAGEALPYGRYAVT